MFRIRFHGRGGQGMKTASRILGTAFFIEGYEIQDAPRYGAERRGAPIFAYVRAALEPINERGVIQHPDLVIVADDTLVPAPAAGVLAGADEHTVLLINSHEEKEIWKERLNLQGPMLILPILEEVEDRAELPFIGATCAGAAARLVGVISRPSLEQAIHDELEHLGQAIVEKNLHKSLEAYDLMAEQSGSATPSPVRSAQVWENPGWIELPFEDACLSTPTIHAGATSEMLKTGLWRTMRPVIDYEHCNRCWWICSTFCPDGAIPVKEDGYPEIDYEHCKGCLICVAQCPPHAIAAIPEHKFQEDAPEGEES